MPLFSANQIVSYPFSPISAPFALLQQARLLSSPAKQPCSNLARVLARCPTGRASRPSAALRHPRRSPKQLGG